MGLPACSSLVNQSMYKPNPQSEFRVKVDFRVDFTNGGYVEGHDFLLDLEGSTVSDDDLKAMIVESMNSAIERSTIRWSHTARDWSRVC